MNLPNFRNKSITRYFAALASFFLLQVAGASANYQDLLEIRLKLCSGDPAQIAGAKETVQNFLKDDPDNLPVLILNSRLLPSDRNQNLEYYLRRIKNGTAPKDEMERAQRIWALFNDETAPIEDLRKSFDWSPENSAVAEDFFKHRVAFKISPLSSDEFVATFTKWMAAPDVDRHLNLLVTLGFEVAKLPAEKKTELVQFYQKLPESDIRDPRKILLQGISTYIQDPRVKFEMSFLERAYRACPVDRAIAAYYRVGLIENKRFGEFYDAVKAEIASSPYGAPFYQAAVGAFYLRKWDEAREYITKAEASAQYRRDPEYQSRTEHLKIEIQSLSAGFGSRQQKIWPNFILFMVFFLALAAFFYLRRRRRSEPRAEIGAIDHVALEQAENSLSKETEEFVALEVLNSLDGDGVLNALELVAMLNAAGIRCHYSESSLFYTQSFSIQVLATDLDRARAVIANLRKNALE